MGKWRIGRGGGVALRRCFIGWSGSICMIRAVQCSREKELVRIDIGPFFLCRFLGREEKEVARKKIMNN